MAYHVILSYKICYPKTEHEKKLDDQDEEEEDLGLDEDIDEDDVDEEVD